MSIYSKRANALLVASLLCGAAIAPAAWAQSAPAPDGVTGLEEVVVTARKRSENLQDTPVSITAFSEQALEARQVTNVADIGRFTPNMSFEQSANLAGSSAAASVFIRGVGQTDFNLTTDPGVGIYLDGVYISRSVGSLLDTTDLAGVEVLRGPQGTLFGKNTIGGAVVLTSVQPGPEREGSVEVTLGRYDRFDVKATANLPITDRLSVRLSATRQARDGYVRRLSDGGTMGDKDSLSGRAIVRFEATPDLTFTLALDGTRSREESVPSILLGVNIVDTPPLSPADKLSFNFFSNKILNGATCGAPFTPTPNRPACFTSQWITGNPYTTWASGPNYSDLDLWGSALTAEWKLGGVDLKSITAYRHLDSQFALETDASPVALAVTSNAYSQAQFSQEFQASGAAFDSRLKWLAGLFYLRETGVDRNDLDFSVARFRSGGSISNDSYAAFGQATYKATDRLSLTFGGRYTDETKAFLPDQVILLDRTGQLAGPGGLSCLLIPTGNPDCNRILPHQRKTVSYNEFTSSFTLDYKLSNDVLAYASYAKGFKSGGFTQRVFPPEPGVPSFDPEFVTNYELGLKTELFDRRLRLNLAAFHSSYEDQQLIVNDGVAPKVRNAGRSRILGAEAEFEWVATTWLRVNGGAGYTDAEYEALDARAAGITLASKLPNAPKWTGNVGASATAWRGAAGELTLRGDLSYKSTTYKDAVNSPLLRQAGYALVNASLRFESADGDWSVTAGGTNLTDKAYLLSGYSDPVALGLTEGAYARPREWFVKLGHKF